MASGDVKLKYAADSTLTVTNLHSLAASSTFIGGWESAAIDNSTDGYPDYKIGFHLVSHASNRQAGTTRTYLVPLINDSLWPDTMDGTESAESWTDTEERDAASVLAAEITWDNTASAVMDFTIPSVAAYFGGNVPKKFVIFVTGDIATSTNAQFASSGSTVTVVGCYQNVAAS